MTSHTNKFPSFRYNDKVHDLGHLNDFAFSVVDSQDNQLTITAKFADHCYLREALSNDPKELQRKRSGPKHKQQGCICLDRYGESLALRTLLPGFGKVWHTREQNRYVYLYRKKHNGVRHVYAIFFDLSVTGEGTLDLFIRSAYLMSKCPETFGEMSFAEVLYKTTHGLPCKRENSPSRVRPSV